MPSLNASYNPSRVEWTYGVNVPVPMLTMAVHQLRIMVSPIEIVGNVAPKGEHRLSLM